MAKKNKVKPLDEEVVETPVEETPVEETPVEEAPAEETPVEETPAEETPAEEETGIVAVGEKKYATFTDAIADYPVGTKIEMTLLEDALDMSGTIVPEGSDVVFAFGGHKVVVTKDPAGSTGTKTQAFQLLKNSTVVMKNGTIESGSPDVKFILQNYSKLTVENMVLNAERNPQVSYAASNNFGEFNVKGSTEIHASEGKVAFDVWYGMSKDGAYDDGVKVSFDKDFTGTVDGKVEYGAASRAVAFEGWTEKAKVEIDAGNFDIRIVNSSAIPEGQKPSIEIRGGNFTEESKASIEEFVEKGGSVVIGDVDTFEELEGIVVGIIGDKTAAPTALSDEDIDKIADAAASYGESDPSKE